MDFAGKHILIFVVVLIVGFWLGKNQPQLGMGII